MLRLKRLNENEICFLYEKSLSRDFPASELKSLSSILELYHRGEYHVLGAYRNEQFVSYALLYCPKNRRLILLDYLAVEPDYRNCGIGTTMLKQLRQHYLATTDALLIECERPKSAPDESEARKRIRFYTNAEAVLTNVRIWLFDVEYSILVLACSDSIPKYEWAEEMIVLYRQMLPEKLFEHNVRLIRG